MQFRKSLLSSNIALILSATGLFALHAPVAVAQPSTNTQTPQQWSCRATPGGQWQCESSYGSPAPSVSSNRARAATATSARGTSTGSGANYNELDWVSRDQLTEEQRQALPEQCCGMFVEPPRSGLYADQDPTEAPTQLETQNNISSPERDRFLIDGGVTLQQGFRSLQASDTTEIDQNLDTITLSGDVIFREPGMLLRGSSAFIDQSNNVSQINQATYVLHDANIHGVANQIIYSGDDGAIIIDNGEFSRCEPGDEFWVLRARRIELDPLAGVGRATAVSLRIRDVPVFYYPFTMPFPIGEQRVSGFLAPSISNSSDEGLDLSIPYYWNLAPHYDATISPRLISERGAMLHTELRYLASWSMNTVNLALMPDDKFYDPAEANIPGSDSPSTDRRWFAGYEHHGALGANWSTFIDYGAISDEDYFRDLGSRGLNVESRTHLNKQGQVNFHTDNWRATTKVQRIELIDPLAASIDINKPYDRMPELTLAGDFQLDSGFEYGFQAAHTSFDRGLDESLLAAQQIDNGALVTGRRINVEPRISWPLRTAGAYVVPTAKYRYASWTLEDQALTTEADPSIGVGVFSLDTGLIFDRPLNFSTNRGFIQTLEPRLFYLYSEFEEQGQLPNFDTAQLSFSFNQLFRDNRFTGGDRFGDTNQVTAALTSRVLDTEGRERARISVGQIFYFEDRQVSLDSPLQNWQVLQPLTTPRSALAAEFDYRFNPNWQVTTDLQWNEDQQRLDEGSFAFRYQSDANHIINVAYRYRENVDIFLPAPPQIDPRIKQTDLSAVWPVNDSWRVLGRWNYDHSNSRNLETFAGVEYSNCCATIRLIAREWIDQYEYLLLENKPNTGIFFQLTLNGLGNVTGGGISRLLTDGIAGFKEYEQ